MLYQVQERERIRKEEQDYMQQQYVAFTAVTGNINCQNTLKLRILPLLYCYTYSNPQCDFQCLLQITSVRIAQMKQMPRRS